jgi:hypothetical protein
MPGFYRAFFYSLFPTLRLWPVTLQIEVAGKRGKLIDAD